MVSSVLGVVTAVTLLLCSLSLPSCTAFAVVRIVARPSSGSSSSWSPCGLSSDPDNVSDFPPNDDDDDDSSTGTDWDAEWKKVVRNQDQPASRPAGAYKSDLELAAAKISRTAETKLYEVKQGASFDLRSLQGDWKFWIGILAVISIGSSLIAAGGQVPYTDESFYI